MDLAQASAALKTPAAKVAPPTDMKDLIARYDTRRARAHRRDSREHQTARSRLGENPRSFTR